MAYKSLYRTYRPQTFDEVVGQQHIIQTLKNALSSGKIAHAYLFAGPRGTGKTTMAKLFAKALNCDEGIGHQCNTCKNCVAITEGSHPDVLELDAASNNGVDEIRELIDKVKYGTILGKYKVYIIDEVHMLSTGAFNALLKTLEEPPEHVVFILATTEPHEILSTILSRCQRYDFTKVSDEDIKQRLKVVLEKENITYNEEAIKLIVGLAEGGMRDALSILEQVLAYSGSNLNEEDILKIFALESKEEKMNLITSVASNDISDVLNRLNNYIQKGTDIKRLTNDLLVMLKDWLVFEGSKREAFLEILKKDDAIKLSTVLDKNHVLKMIDILMTTLKDYKNVSSINPLFEVTLLKLASVEDDAVVEVKKPVIKQEPLFEKDENVKSVEKPIEVKKETPVEIVNEETTLIETESLEEIGDPIYLKDAEKDDSFKIDDDLMMKVMVTSKKEIKSEIKDGWSILKKYITHPKLGKIATLLIDCHILVASKKVVIIETELPKMADKINTKENQKEFQILLNHIYKRKMFIYAIPRAESVRLQQKYLSAAQIGKLPKAIDINLEFKGE